MKPDRIIASGGYVSVNTGNAQDANNILIPKTAADEAFAGVEEEIERWVGHGHSIVLGVIPAQAGIQTA